ncbi:DUF4190 domain-containing protein [Nonomuraea rubra]|uniref:DUF4190 domain-containing protein n=1 Tax=Nonomuraea rubra TaxID=46180 RepID=UPI0036162CF2
MTYGDQGASGGYGQQPPGGEATASSRRAGAATASNPRATAVATVSNPRATAADTVSSPRATAADTVSSSRATAATATSRTASRTSATASSPERRLRLRPAAAPGYYAPPHPPRSTNGMAVASLVLGIIGLVFCGLTSIPGVILGHIALNRIKKTGEDGSGMAVGGLVTSYITVVIWLLCWLFFGGFFLWMLGLSAAASSSYDY